MWLPAAIVLFGERAGATIGDWEKAGWWRATYRDVSYAFPGGTVTIGEATAPVFAVWPRLERDPTIELNDIRVVLEPKEPPQPEPQTPETSVYQIVSMIDRLWPEVRRWLPSTRIGQTTVEMGELKIDIHSLRWDGETLAVEGEVPGIESTATATFTRREDGGYSFKASAPEREAALEVMITRDPESIRVDANATWLTNVVEVEAAFGTEGMLPVAASVEAPDLRVPAGLVKLSGYGPIEGGLSVAWDGARYAISSQARAAPVDEEGALPPVAVDVRAAGDLEQARVEAVEITAPGIDAQLSAPLEWRFDAGIPATAGQFTLALDVEKMPWITGTGAVEGTADIARRESGEPVVDFQLRGRDLFWRSIEDGAFTLAGQWAPPLISVEELTASIGETTTLEASGAADLEARTIDRAEVRLELAPEAVRAWVPDAPDFAGASLVATVSGPLQKPDFETTLELRELAGLPGGTASLEAHATGAGIEAVDLDATLTSAAGITVPLRAAVARESSGAIEVGLQTLRWEDAGGLWWALEQPATVSIAAPAPDGGVPAVTLGRLSLTGDAFAFAAAGSIRWPAEGHVSVQAGKIEAGRLQPFLGDAYKGIFLQSLTLDADWSDGPVTLDGLARVRYSPKEDASYAVEAAFRSAEDSSSVTADLNIEAESGIVLSGSGRVPLILTGSANGFSAQLPKDGELALDLASQPNPVFWESITELTGWTVSDPALRASLAGTLDAPRGEVAFSAARLLPPERERMGEEGWGEAEGAEEDGKEKENENEKEDEGENEEERPKLPGLTDLSVQLIADDEGVKLTEALVALEHKWIRMEAEAPWQIWRTFQEEKRFDWRDLSFSLAAEPLPVEIAARFAPTVLAPDGQVSIDVRHGAGEGFGGRVWLHDAALRPLPSIGAVRGIHAEFVFDEYQVRLPELSLLIGGREVEISGQGRVQPGEPLDFELRARSERVPLVRATGTVVRAALDISVRKQGTGPASITGEVELGPSVYTSEFTSLIPTGGVTAPEQRPPFFSVKAEPFASWTLDVAVKGGEFLRVENPLFSGMLSADFQLLGTLEEPKAIGRITSKQGTIVFPFASMALSNLEVTLSEENPYEPQILVTAGTRVFGYDLRMEATGSASNPELDFSASPPLSSQQVFLMITSGALPDEERSFSTSERARRLAFYIGKNLASDFGIGGGGGGGEDRLTVRSGEDFTREGKETIYIEYDITDRWAIVGEYDRFDEYNGGVKFNLVRR
ncbi:MAG: translocation/assembly module TamB domain-containing protein [Opitutaceae bacterium]